MGRTVLLSLVVVAGCVFGARGERDFRVTYDLQGIDTVNVSPSNSPIRVAACDANLDTCPRAMEVEGTWLAFGGTKSEAKKIAERGELSFEAAGGFAVLTEVTDLRDDELLRLELGEIRIPDDVDLELFTGAGDVEVTGSRANVRVVVDAGDVAVFGADAGVVVRTGWGDVDVHSPAVVDLATDRGTVHLAQTGSERDAYVELGGGELQVDLASDANLSLFIEASGTIDVKTGAINTITGGTFYRETGNATVRVHLVNRGGPVTVRLYGDTP